jgi:hypothetical protein
VATFAAFRARIPAGAEVFWADSPVSIWVLLDRPSYLSVLQTSGMVFSRATALELERRASALAAVLPPQSFLSWKAGFNPNLSVRELRGACRLAVFPYLVTSADLGWAPLETVPLESRWASGDLKLYRCSKGAAEDDS